MRSAWVPGSMPTPSPLSSEFTDPVVCPGTRYCEPDVVVIRSSPFATWRFSGRYGSPAADLGCTIVKPVPTAPPAASSSSPPSVPSNVSANGKDSDTWPQLSCEYGGQPVTCARAMMGTSASSVEAQTTATNDRRRGEPDRAMRTLQG